MTLQPKISVIKPVIKKLFSHILECEFYLLELMDCCLIVFHPYRPLLQFLSDLNITKSDDPLSLLSWRIINDSYRYSVFPNVSYVFEMKYPPADLIFGTVKYTGNMFYCTNNQLRRLCVGRHFICQKN